MSQRPPAAMVALAQLRQLIEAEGTTRRVAEVARQRLEGIESSCAFLEDRSHSIAFIGQIGVGKSSMIGVLADLIVGDPPTDRASLKDNLVLAVGSGGTTVCEVRIVRTPEARQGKVGMSILPYSVEEMRTEIGDFAHHEWARRKETMDLDGAAEDREPTPREIRRVIRHMTNLVEKHQTYQEGGQKKRRTIDPLDDLVARHDSAKSLAHDLLERAHLVARTETEWWWNADPTGLRELKRWFHEVNHGQAAAAMLPKLITLSVSSPLPGSTAGLDLELVDTRGFDGQLEGRPDLQAALRDPRALVIVCTPFKEAPGEQVRSLLKTIAGNADLRQAAPRLHLLLLDHGDSEQANDAEGDRDVGQSIKLNECKLALASTAGLEPFAQDEHLGAYDALRDERDAVVAFIDERLKSLRGDVERRLAGQVSDALSFLANIEDQRVDLARSHIDRWLLQALTGNSPSGVPMRDPLAGLYAAIRGCRYASQVYASCRRSGSFPSMDAYAAIQVGASAAATEWIAPLHAALGASLNTLAQDLELDVVRDHLRLRRAQLRSGYVTSVRTYANAVRIEVAALLVPAQVWSVCAGEWGRGPGFKLRVIDHLERWSRKQAGMQRHETLDPHDLMPELPLGHAEADE